jgi:hypothetical protein
LAAKSERSRSGRSSKACRFGGTTTTSAARSMPSAINSKPGGIPAPAARPPRRRKVRYRPRRSAVATLRADGPQAAHLIYQGVPSWVLSTVRLAVVDKSMVERLPSVPNRGSNVFYREAGATKKRNSPGHMLVLRTLLFGPAHGHQIGKRIRRDVAWR